MAKKHHQKSQPILTPPQTYIQPDLAILTQPSFMWTMFFVLSFLFIVFTSGMYGLSWWKIQLEAGRVQDIRRFFKMGI